MSTAQFLRGLQAVAPIIVASSAISGCSPSVAATPRTALPATSRVVQPSANSARAMLGRPAGLDSIQHIVVIYQENWSFDSLYGRFPGANGVSAGVNVAQNAWNGPALTSAPQPLNAKGDPDNRFPQTMPLQTYWAYNYVPDFDKTGDIIHRYYHELYQIDSGRMDKFVTYSDNGGLVLSQYDGSKLPEGQLARQYTIADNYFHSAFGGSFLNHQFLICACAPVWTNPPANYVSVPNKNPAKLNDNHVTPDGHAINTSYTVFNPHPKGVASEDLVPPLTEATIGDRLNDAKVSWKWYSGGWDSALEGRPAPLFQFHHQPFAYYKNYGDGTTLRKQHLVDQKSFIKDLTNGSLPAVSFIKQIGQDNEHPGYSSLLQGQTKTAEIVNQIRGSSAWNSTVIIITYDENGGRWDHVAPPSIDRWGPGSRVPAIIISPFAKKGFVDHTQYETASILALIEKRYNLKPLGTRDERANPFSNAFNL